MYKGHEHQQESDAYESFIRRHFYCCCLFPGDVVYHGNVSASAKPEHEIFELIPSSNYSIRIRAWNYELAGEYGPAIWVQTD